MPKNNYGLTVRAKGIFDGCKNTKQMIKRCQKLQQYIEKLDKDKLKLEGEVHSDYAHFTTQDGTLGRKYGMYKVEEDEE